MKNQSIKQLIPHWLRCLPLLTLTSNFTSLTNFCYADKFAILTKGLDIVQHTSFIDNADFKTSYPDLIVEKEMDLPDEDNSVNFIVSCFMTFPFPKHPFPITPKTKAL